MLRGRQGTITITHICPCPSVCLAVICPFVHSVVTCSTWPTIWSNYPHAGHCYPRLDGLVDACCKNFRIFAPLHSSSCSPFTRSCRSDAPTPYAFFCCSPNACPLCCCRHACLCWVVSSCCHGSRGAQVLLVAEHSSRAPSSVVQVCGYVSGGS